MLIANVGGGGKYALQDSSMYEWYELSTPIIYFEALDIPTAFLSTDGEVQKKWTRIGTSADKYLRSRTEENLF